jgi:hypothetical protein
MTTTNSQLNNNKYNDEMRYFKTKKINIIKKYYNNNNNISYVVEEYAEYEHKFNLESDYGTNSELFNKDNSQNSSINKYKIDDDTKSISIPLQINNVKKEDDKTISSSLEEDSTSYFNLVTKKNNNIKITSNKLDKNPNEDEYVFI